MKVKTDTCQVAKGMRGRAAPVAALFLLFAAPTASNPAESASQGATGEPPASGAIEAGLAPADPDPNSADYLIGVEDVIQISVWKNADLTVTVPVRPDGKISLPLIDDVQAAGLRPLQLKEELTRRWKAFLSAPEVSVIVKEVNSYKVYLVGEIAKPGQLQLRGPTRLLQALSLAGGLTNFADKSRIIVLRESAGAETRHEISYKRVVSGKRPEDNILLMPGDTIVVP